MGLLRSLIFYAYLVPWIYALNENFVCERHRVNVNIKNRYASNEIFLQIQNQKIENEDYIFAVDLSEHEFISRSVKGLLHT